MLDYKSEYSLILSLVIILVIIPISYSQTLTVCASGCDFSSIQPAINSAQNLDTLIVVSGNFNENLLITKPLTIQFMNAYLSGTGNGNATAISSENVTLINFNITNYEYGIVAVGKNLSNIQIVNSTISGVSNSGIFLGDELPVNPVLDFSGTVIKGSRISNAGSCLRISSSSNINIQENNIMSCKIGINITSSAGISITANNISNISYSGIFLDDDSSSVSAINLTYNNIYDNSFFGINNLAMEKLIAENNYWGNSSGPKSSSNTYNKDYQGDNSSDNVDFVPWLSSAYPETSGFYPISNTEGNYFSSIQDAINNATSGSTITITLKSGTFTENIRLSKTITLSGAGNGNGTSATIIKSSSENTPILNISSGGNSTARLILRDFRTAFSMGTDFSGSGILLSNASYVSLENISASNNQGYGIAIDSAQASEDFILRNIIAEGNSKGIFLRNISMASITNSMIKDNCEGIYIEGNISGIVIQNNTIQNNDCTGSLGIRNNASSEINAAFNYWGNFSGPFEPALNPSGKGNRISGNISFKPFYLDMNKFGLSGDYQVLLGEIIIPINNPAANITIPLNVSNATLNLALLITERNATRNATLSGEIIIISNTSSGKIILSLPENLTFSGTINWSGIVNTPRIKSSSNVSVNPDDGKSVSGISSVIEVGSDDIKLVFDKAVRILMAGQSGKDLGYYRASQFTAIKTLCVNDSQDAGNSLSSEGNCKINNGTDLIIWTKHFTRFVTYSQEDLPPESSSGSSGSSGGGGGGGIYYCASNWTCTEWSECSENGIEIRTCTDLKKCKTAKSPEQVRTCKKNISESPVESEDENNQSSLSINSDGDSSSLGKKNDIEELSLSDNKNKSEDASNSSKNKFNLITGAITALSSRNRIYGIIMLSAVIIGLMGLRYFSIPRNSAQHYAKASSLHKKAEKLYRKGKTVKAELYYRKAQIHREKAGDMTR